MSTTTLPGIADPSTLVESARAQASAAARRAGVQIRMLRELIDIRASEDLFASDVVGAVMALDGIEAVCLNRFKRLGQRYPDAADSGRIELNEIEVAVCDTDPAHPERGRLNLRVKGGLAG